MILYNKAIRGHPVDLVELCPSGAGQRLRFSRPRRVDVDARQPGVGTLPSVRISTDEIAA